MGGTVLDLTDANFEQSTKTGVTLVDFWAPWCPPCRMQGPIVEKFAETMKGRMTVAKLNVDENPKVAAKFGVNNIPTLIIIKDGKEAKRMVGLQQEASLTNAMNGLI